MEIKQYSRGVTPTESVGMNFTSAAEKAHMRKVRSVNDERANILAETMTDAADKIYKIEYNRQVTDAVNSQTQGLDNLLVKLETDPEWKNLEYDEFIKKYDEEAETIRQNSESKAQLPLAAQKFKEISDSYSNKASIKATFIGRKYLIDKSNSLRDEANSVDINKSVYGDLEAYARISSRIEDDVNSGLISREQGTKELQKSQNNVGIGFAEKLMREEASGVGPSAYDVLLNNPPIFFKNLDQPTKERLLMEAFNLKNRISSARDKVNYAERYKLENDFEDLENLVRKKGKTKFTRIDDDGKEVTIDINDITLRARTWFKDTQGVAKAMEYRDKLNEASNEFNVVSKLFTEDINTNEATLEQLKASSGDSAFAAELAKRFEDNFNLKRKQLKEDAVGYYIKGHFSMYDQEPTISDIKAFQERNGVPLRERGLVSKSTAITNANLLKDATPEIAAQELMSQKQILGADSKLYFRDLVRHGNIDKSLQFAMAQDTVENAAAVIRNGRMKDDELKVVVKDFKDSRDEINKTLDRELKGFKGAFFKGGRIEDKIYEYSTINEALQKQALALLATGKESDPTKAAKAAAQLILTENVYEKVNNEYIMIPNSVGKTEINSYSVRRNLDYILRSYDNKTINRHGYFVNNSDGDGVVLFSNNRPVAIDGEVQEFKFRDLNVVDERRIIKANISKRIDKLRAYLEKNPDSNQAKIRLETAVKELEKLQ